jgi:tripartite-type tricarboxylate transporter receptor subunit TctC
MYTRRMIAKGALAALGTVNMPAILRAQDADYPKGPLRAICMFPPGSGADISVRYFSAKLAKLVNQSVIVENRVGANGNLANEFVARSKPDGYTIYIAPGSSVLAPAPHLFKKINFDPLNDFEHITTLYSTQFLLCVDGQSPFKTLPELTAFLREKGENASYGSTANTGVIASEFYKSAFGLKTVEVKYKVSQTTYNDLSSGALAFAHLDFRGNAGAIRSGRVRALATSSDQRMRALPDTPSAKEAGIGNYIMAWWSVHMPAKTPEPILGKLEGWFNQIVKDPETEKFLVDSGSEPLPGNRKLVRAMLERDLKSWAEWVKIARIEPI